MKTTRVWQGLYYIVYIPPQADRQTVLVYGEREVQRDRQTETRTDSETDSAGTWMFWDDGHSLRTSFPRMRSKVGAPLPQRVCLALKNPISLQRSTHTHARARAHTHTHTQTHRHTDTQTHRHTHTHTPRSQPLEGLAFKQLRVSFSQLLVEMRSFCSLILSRGLKRTRLQFRYRFISS